LARESEHALPGAPVHALVRHCFEESDVPKLTSRYWGQTAIIILNANDGHTAADGSLLDSITAIDE